MDFVDKKKFDRSSPIESDRIAEKSVSDISEAEFNKMIADMQNPVEAQKRVAVQMKIFLDRQINEEMATKKYLSDHTRRWVKIYNETLEKIQKALYGDKSTNLNLNIHKVSHGDIAAKIRKAKKLEIGSSG